MGLFDKRDKGKRHDDFDSPVERVDLSGALEGASPPEPSLAAPAGYGAAPAAPPVAHAPEPEPEPETGSFGIDKAIQLMRTLPTDNIELVVQVVKLTLESTRIKIATIIDDASRRQDDIQGRIKVLKEEIAEFEKEIAQRREEIAGLDADFTETSMVKDRLQLAEKLSTKGSQPVTSGGKDRASTAGSIGSAVSAGTQVAGTAAPSSGSGGLPRPSGSPAPSGTPGTSGSHTIVAKK